MTASSLKREIEMVLGLSDAQAAALWQAARAVKPSTTAAAGYNLSDPRFVGGVFVRPPAGPVPIPYPNLSAGEAATPSQRQVAAGHKFTLEKHFDVIPCVLAASRGYAAEAQARVTWVKTRRKLELQTAPVRNALGRELIRLLQQARG